MKDIRATVVNYDFADCTSTRKRAVLVDYRGQLPKTDQELSLLAETKGAVKRGMFTDRSSTYLVFLFKTVRAARSFSSAILRTVCSNGRSNLATAGV